MTKEQHELWISLPETQEVLGKVAERIKNLAQHMANGGTINKDSMEVTVMNTADTVAEIRGTSFILGELWDD